MFKEKKWHQTCLDLQLHYSVQRSRVCWLFWPLAELCLCPHWSAAWNWNPASRICPLWRGSLPPPLPGRQPVKSIYTQMLNSLCTLKNIHLTTCILTCTLNSMRIKQHMNTEQHMNTQQHMYTQIHMHSQQQHAQSTHTHSTTACTLNYIRTFNNKCTLNNIPTLIYTPKSNENVSSIVDTVAGSI